MAGHKRWMVALILPVLMGGLTFSLGQEKQGKESVFDLNTKKEASPGYTREVGGVSFPSGSVT